MEKLEALLVMTSLSRGKLLLKLATTYVTVAQTTVLRSRSPASRTFIVSATRYQANVQLAIYIQFVHHHGIEQCSSKMNIKRSEPT